MTEIVDLPSAAAVLREILFDDPPELVAMTGAGISTESGIPDFRSPGGLWTKISPIQFDEFIGDEEKRLEDWRRRFEMKKIFDDAEPNDGHRFLADLANSDRLELLITQNVDGLHQRAGTPDHRMVELHGNSTYATCLSCGARAELADQAGKWASGATPVCDACGGLLKAAVVSFGQAMPDDAMRLSLHAAESCEVFLVIGSSLTVLPAAHLPAVAAQSGAELIIVNRDETPLDSMASLVIRTPISETFGLLRS